MQTIYNYSYSLKAFSVWVILILSVLGFNTIQAQETGNIEGVIIEAGTGEPLFGANAIIIGTSKGAATDLDGRFIIRSVEAGEHQLKVSFLGFQTTEEIVTVTAGETIQVEFELRPAGFVGDELTITSQRRGQVEAINEQLSSSTIKNVVSAERIQEIPDINAAESVGRLSGVSVVRSGGEGQKVTIRGVSPQFNVIMVNGVRVESTDRNNRSVDLNMIAPNVLSGISVTKALTADMDADAVGGTVNLQVGTAKKGLNGNFSLQNGYASMANTQGQRFGNYRLSGNISNRFFNDKLGVQLSGYIDAHNRNSDVLGVGYYTNEDDVGEDGFVPLYLGGVNIVDRITDRQRAGGSLVLDYKLKNGSLIFNNFISRLQDDQIIHSNNFSTGLSWRGTAEDNESNTTVINNALQGDFDFGALQMDFSLSSSISRQRNPGTLTLDLRPGQAETQGLEPLASDLFLMSHSMFLESVEIINSGKILRDLRTLSRDVDAVGQVAALNFTAPFNLTEYLSGNLKIGGKYERNTRDNDEEVDFIDLEIGGLTAPFVNFLRDTGWQDLGTPADAPRIPSLLFEDGNYEVKDFLSGNEGISGDRFYNLVDIEMMNRLEKLAIENGFYTPDPLGSSQYDYDYTRNFHAYYMSAEINVGDYVTLLPGLRYESFTFDYTADSTTVFGRLTTPGEHYFNSETLNFDSIEGEKWFPQVQVQIKPTDWFDIRLARTESIIYPDFRAISPYVYLDTYNDPILRLGNPSLKTATSENYDIYASVYENHIGLFTAGVFSKNIDDFIVPIEYFTKDASLINDRVPLFQNGSPTVINTWTNLDRTANVRGIELEWQTSFWYLPSFFQGLVFNINYTHINSETFYPRYFTKREGTFPNISTIVVDTVRSGRLINQPDNILNLTIGYDLGGFSTRLSYQYTDNILRGIHSTYKELDSFTAPYKRWDLSARQKFSKFEGFEIFMNLNNITNTPDRQLRSTRRKLSNVEYYGRTVTLGARYTF